MKYIEEKKYFSRPRNPQLSTYVVFSCIDNNIKMAFSCTTIHKLLQKLYCSTIEVAMFSVLAFSCIMVFRFQKHWEIVKSVLCAVSSAQPCFHNQNTGLHVFVTPEVHLHIICILCVLARVAIMYSANQGCLCSALMLPIKHNTTWKEQHAPFLFAKQLINLSFAPHHFHKNLHNYNHSCLESSLKFESNFI